MCWSMLYLNVLSLVQSCWSYNYRANKHLAERSYVLCNVVSDSFHYFKNRLAYKTTGIDCPQLLTACISTRSTAIAVISDCWRANRNCSNFLVCHFRVVLTFEHWFRPTDHLTCCRHIICLSFRDIHGHTQAMTKPWP